MINSQEFSVFTCLLLDKINSANEKCQIMIFLNSKELKIYKLIKSTLSDNNDKIKVNFIFFINFDLFDGIFEFIF